MVFLEGDPKACALAFAAVAVAVAAAVAVGLPALSRALTQTLALFGRQGPPPLEILEEPRALLWGQLHQAAHQATELTALLGWQVTKASEALFQRTSLMLGLGW